MKKKNLSINWLKLSAWVVGVELVGVTGSYFSIGAIDSWYRFLNKPAFNPPNWLFGPVWVMLYIMIGVVGYQLWQKTYLKEKLIKRLFIIQLALNAIWSPVFFGLKHTDWALTIILLLWFTITLLIVKLWSEKKSLIWWLAPYWFWVSFASVLNFSIWLLN